MICGSPLSAHCTLSPVIVLFIKLVGGDHSSFDLSNTEPRADDDRDDCEGRAEGNDDVTDEMTEYVVALPQESDKSHIS